MKKRANIIDLPLSFVRKLDPARPAAEQIASYLRTAILDTSLAPGQIVAEKEIAQLFGASRTPVREALNWLRQQELIVTYPSRGNYVSKLSITQIRGVQFVRESLEVSVAVKLCETGLPEKNEREIADNLDAQQKMAKSGDRSGFHFLDDNFHIALVNAAGHPRVSALLKKEKASLDRIRVLSLNSPRLLQTLVEDHLAIFDAIRDRDTSSAAHHLRTHLRRVLDTLSDLVANHRDYFEDE